MAKKAAAAVAPPPAVEESEPLKAIPSFTEGGKGRRLCVQCEQAGHKDKFTGARTLVCKHGHTKPDVAPNSARPATRRAAAAGPDLEKTAMEFVLFESSGSLDKALKAVENYSEDGLAKFVADCGGADNARAVLEKLASRKQ